MSALSTTDQLRARHNVACGLANLALVQRRAENLARAHDHAALLLDAIFQGRTSNDALLKTLATHLRTPAALLYAGILAMQAKPASRAAGGTRRSRKATDETATQRPPLDPKDHKLKAAVDQRSHRAIVEALTESAALESPRAAYSFACYYATVGPANFNRAFNALAIAIADPATRDWAPKDPWLKALRRETKLWTELFPKPPKP